MGTGRPTGPIEDVIGSLVGPLLEGMGYVLVRVRHSGGRRPTLQVMAERGDGRPMSVDDCSAISRAVSAKLDVEDPIEGAYNLEVSSPGIDRPLVRLEDYRRFAGMLARIETREPVGGRRRFTGRLRGVEGAEVLLRLDDGDVALPFAIIGRAKLVLTDELIAAAQAGPEVAH